MSSNISNQKEPRLSKEELEETKEPQVISGSGFLPAGDTPVESDESLEENDELEPDSMAGQSQEEEVIQILETNQPPTPAQRAYMTEDNSNIFFIEEKTALTYSKKFVLDDAEEVKKELEFRHSEADGQGTIEVYEDSTFRKTFERTMTELVVAPIRFYVTMNSGKLNLIEYYCGADVPGCHLKVNFQEHRHLASGPEPEDPPEYQRGGMKCNFEGIKKTTSYIVYAGLEEECLVVNITHCMKTQSFMIECDKKKEIIRKVSWQKLQRRSTTAKLIV